MSSWNRTSQEYVGLQWMSEQKVNVTCPCVEISWGLTARLDGARLQRRCSGSFTISSTTMGESEPE